MLEKMKQKYHRIQKFHFWVYTRRIGKQNFILVPNNRIHLTSLSKRKFNKD